MQAVAAVESSVALGDLEAADMEEGGSEGSSAGAFKVLKGLLHSWLTDATTHSSM